MFSVVNRLDSGYSETFCAAVMPFADDKGYVPCSGDARSKFKYANGGGPAKGETWAAFKSRAVAAVTAARDIEDAETVVKSLDKSIHALQKEIRNARARMATMIAERRAKLPLMTEKQRTARKLRRQYGAY